MSKLVKIDSTIKPASDFAAKVKTAVDESLARPALTHCPACGSTSMNDPQAQYVGACSAKCARKLDVTEETLRESGRVPPEMLPTAIAQRVEVDYDTMAQIIVHEWLERFGEPDPDDINELNNEVLRTAVKRARFLGVKPSADVDVSECGCIWALQTVYAVGEGDVILRQCDKHAAVV